MKHQLILLAVSSLTVFNAFSQSRNGDFHLDKEYKVLPNGTIALSTSDAKVSIVGSNRTTAHVTIDHEVHTRGMVFGESEFAVNIEENDGNLEIKERSGSTSVGIIGYHYEKYTISIEVPMGVSLLLKGDDGDYVIRSVNGSIDASLDDGDIELVGCKGSDFKFRLDDGDIKMDEGKGSLEIDADDADIVIEKGSFSKIVADVDDGDFIVETSLTDGGDYFIDAQDGLISLTILGGGGKIDIMHDDARVMTDGNFSMVEKSDDRTRLTLGNGNAKIDIRADDARVKLISR
jgi:hypothetical protein